MVRFILFFVLMQCFFLNNLMMRFDCSHLCDCWQLRALKMVWNSPLLGLLTGLDLEWISFLASMVQVRVFLGFLHALAMLVSYFC